MTVHSYYAPAIKLDCSYAEEHAAHHHEHPDTGRLVCFLCHPPAFVLRNNAEAARREGASSGS